MLTPDLPRCRPWPRFRALLFLVFQPYVRHLTKLERLRERQPAIIPVSLMAHGALGEVMGLPSIWRLTEGAQVISF